MIVLKSLVGTCITNKLNIVSDTIPGIFLMVISDVIKPWNSTIEVTEQKFSTLRQENIEFNVHELNKLCETNSCCMALIFRNDFILNQDPRKG